MKEKKTYNINGIDLKDDRILSVDETDKDNTIVWVSDLTEYKYPVRLNLVDNEDFEKGIVHSTSKGAEEQTRVLLGILNNNK